MDPRLFWDSTFYELGLFLEGARGARRDQYNYAVTTAWHAAVFVWTKHLPQLQKVLAGEVERDEPRTWQEDVARFRAFVFTQQPDHKGH